MARWQHHGNDAPIAVYEAPREEVRFGDIFEGEYLLDLFGRSDTALMGGGILPAHLAPKFSRWVGVEIEPQELLILCPLFPPKEEERFALGHASMPDAEPRRAVILSDDCAIDTALAQGRELRSVGGRLLFAPLRPVDADMHERLTQRPDFGRFPLPPNEQLGAPAVAEMRHVFMVEAQHVKAHAADRLLAATTPLSEDLEAHWNAYAARRGPVAYERNCLKLAELIALPDGVNEQHEEDAVAVASLLDRVWRLEGGELEAASTAHEQLEELRAQGGEVTTLAPPVVEGLIRGLTEISELSGAAAAALERYR